MRALLFVLFAFAILVACNSSRPGENIGATAEALPVSVKGLACTTNGQCVSQTNDAPFCVDAVCCTSTCGGGQRDDQTCSNVYSSVAGVDVYAGTGKSPGECITLQIGQPCGSLVSSNPCKWRGSDVNGGHQCPSPNDGLTYACYPCGAGCPAGQTCSCPTTLPVCVNGGCSVCTSSTQCTDPANPVCDTSTGACVTCTASNPGPCLAGCDTATNTCFPCDNTTHLCPTGLVCDTTSGSCVQCNDYTQCANPNPVCSNHSCVGCTTDYVNGTPTQCPVAASSSTTATGPACVGTSCLQCDKDGQCTTDANKPKCNTAGHACVQCNGDTDCLPFQGGGPALFCINHACSTACAPDGVNASCEATDPTKPYCAGGFCEQCRTTVDCGQNGAPAGFCIGNLCKECEPGLTDCGQTTAKPVCDASGTCVPCTSDHGTGSGLECPTTTRPACTAVVGGAGQCVECTSEDRTRCAALGLAQCDTTTNKCAGCLSNGDCTDLSKPICDKTVGSPTYETCVPCNGDTGSPTATAACPVTSPPAPACVGGKCVQCSNTNFSACTAALPVCFNTKCVQCTSDAQCLVGPNGKCDTTTHTCTSGCSTNANCIAPTPICDVPTTTCVQCEADVDCPTGQKCNGATHQCVQCTDNTQCSGATPICDGGTCVACGSDKGSGGADECYSASTPACVKTGADVGKCVTCTTADAVLCTGATPACNDTSHTCVQCGSNAQCSGNTPICNAAGSCVACGADNGGGGATACPTTTKPACIKTGTKSGSCQECSGTNATACTVSKPVCNTTSEADVCVECNSNADCHGANGVCNTNSHTCTTGCASDANCSASAPACKLPDGFCVQCTPTDSGACTGATPVCDPTNDTCVGCTASSQCPGDKPVCDPTTKTCTSSCTTSAQCPGETPVCNPTTHTCTQCATSADCPPSAPICDPATGKCGTTCTQSSQCPGDKPVCNPTSHQCVQCGDNTNCPPNAPICDPSTGTCGTSCTASSQCPGDKPVCDPASKQCVQCTDDGNCPASAPRCDGTTHTCTAGVPPTDFALEGGGCSCSTAGGTSSSTVPVLLGIGLAASAIARRRRDRRDRREAAQR